MVAGVGSGFAKGDRRSRRVGEPIFSQKKLGGPPDLDAAPDAMPSLERLKRVKTPSLLRASRKPSGRKHPGKAVLFY